MTGSGFYYPISEHKMYEIKLTIEIIIIYNCVLIKKLYFFMYSPGLQDKEFILHGGIDNAPQSNNSNSYFSGCILMQ